MKATNKDESDLSSFKAGLSARLKKLEESYANRADAVRAYGVPKSAYEMWVYARSSPSVEALAKIAKVANVSLDWLAFGTNAGHTPSDDYAAGVEPPKNYDWMDEILGLLGDVYRFAGHNPPPDSLYHEAADIYKGIIQWDTSEDRSKAITLAIGMMSSNIKPPEAAPETTEDKRRA